MTISTTKAAQTAMAHSIMHLMDSLEDGVALEITRKTCVISLANSRFVFDNCESSLCAGIDSIEFLNPYQEV